MNSSEQYELFDGELKITNKGSGFVSNELANENYFIKRNFLKGALDGDKVRISINSTFGVLRCRYDVSPLHAACFNSNVPLRIIKHLIENGADTKHPISVNGDKINILDDLDDNNNFRSESIRKFLFKHKLNI